MKDIIDESNKLGKPMTGFPSIDKPWLKYYSEEAINAPLPECTLYEMLWKNNKDHLDDIAINYFHHRFTYKQLFDGIERAAKAFFALGVTEGDIVLLSTVNTPETVYAFYALNRLGAVANMVDPRTSVSGLHDYILEAGVKVILTVDQVCSSMRKAAEGTSVKKIIRISLADSMPLFTKILYRAKNKLEIDDKESMSWGTFEQLGTPVCPKYASYKKDTCCVIAHTGGTTGLPKGVMLSNDNFNAVMHAYQYTGITFERQHKYFNDLPPFIMYGLCLATHTTLCYGLEVIFYPICDAINFPKQFMKYRPNHFCGLADHLKYLSTNKKSQKINLEHLITVGVGGDTIDLGLEKSVNEYLLEHDCKFEVMKGYGMTELSATAVSSSPKANAVGSVGIPFMHNIVKVMSTETRKELAYNETGELWVSGPSVMMGYYQKPEETDCIISVDENGVRWVHTGDLGYMSENGLLFLEGRIRRIYVTSYEGQPAKIFPMLVEKVLKQSPAVSECSVVGRKQKNSDFYEAVAFIVKDEECKNAVDIKKLKDLCIESLPIYMVPVEFCFINALPRTPIGKIDFRTLEREAERQAR